MWLCALLFGFLGVTTVHAKPSQPVLLFCAAYSQDVKSVYLKTGKNEYQSVALSFANVIELPACPIEKGKITFFGPVGEDGQHSIAAIAEINSISTPLIVLHPSAPDAQTPYQAIAINADTEQFPLTSFQLLNLSPYPVRIDKDDETPVAELPSDSSHNFKPSSPAGNPFAIQVKYKIDDAWILLSSSSWVARNDRRTLVCILPDPRSERMNIRSVPLRKTARR